MDHGEALMRVRVGSLAGPTLSHREVSMLRSLLEQRVSEGDPNRPVVSGCWWKSEKASSSSEFGQRLALAGRRVKEDDAYGKG